MAQTDDFWSDPEMFESGDYVKFDDVNDTVTGTITAIKRHSFEDGKVVPSLELNTPDGPKTLTAGQVRLKAELARVRPNVGDQITITLTNVEKRAGGKTLKHFDVVVGPGTAPAVAVAEPQAAAAPAFDPSSLTPEQLAALLAAAGQK